MYSLRNIVLLTSVTTITSLLYYKWNRKEKPSPKMLIAITGCDSGLGFSLAVHANDLGFTVVAGCLNPDSEGAKILSNMENVFVASLNITDEKSVELFLRKVGIILEGKEDLELRALVNNAGVMVFGEFEWQTEKLIKHQVEVNLLGTMRVTRAFCPMLRKYKGRIVNIISHCAKESLPGLSVYGATKAALEGWSDGIRVELDKFDIKVIKFVPGSFFMQSNIMSRQLEYASEMKSSLSEESSELYGEYFSDFFKYLSALSVARNPVKIEDRSLYAKFEDMLLSYYPCAYYENAPLRYTIYHSLFKISPVWLRDKLIRRFVSTPEWRKGKAEKKLTI